jgi:hypothetical protein
VRKACRRGIAVPCRAAAAGVRDARVALSPWRHGGAASNRDRRVVDHLRPAGASGALRHRDCLHARQGTDREEVYAMRGLILYMLGVPVFLIVILWLFGVV